MEKRRREGTHEKMWRTHLYWNRYFKRKKKPFFQCKLANFLFHFMSDSLRLFGVLLKLTYPPNLVSIGETGVGGGILLTLRRALPTEFFFFFVGLGVIFVSPSNRYIWTRIHTFAIIVEFLGILPKCKPFLERIATDTMLWGHLLRSRIICSPLANWVICILQPHPWGWLNWKLVAVQSRDVKSFEGKKNPQENKKETDLFRCKFSHEAVKLPPMYSGKPCTVFCTVFLCVSAEINFVSFPLPSSLVNSRLSPYHYEEDSPPTFQTTLCDNPTVLPSVWLGSDVLFPKLSQAAPVKSTARHPTRDHLRCLSIVSNGKSRRYAEGPLYSVHLLESAPTWGAHFSRSWSFWRA